MFNFIPPFIENKQSEIGEVQVLRIPDPGIYHLQTSIHDDLYVVPLDYEGDTLTREVFQYGHILDDVAIFPPVKEQYLIEYELAAAK